MKIEVINPSTNEVIETYFVPDLSRFDFQEWKGDDDVIIHMKCLFDNVKKLDSKDPFTEEPVSNSHNVGFYLPDPIIKNAITQFTKSRTDMTESSENILDEVSEQAFMSKLKSSTILTAVVTEILQNHHERSDYKVKITDG